MSSSKHSIETFFLLRFSLDNNHDHSRGLLLPENILDELSSYRKQWKDLQERKKEEEKEMKGGSKAE